MKTNVKTRLVLILFLTGMTGIVSVLLIDLAAVVALVPVPAGSEALTITPLIKILSLIQPAILLAAAVLIGVALTSRVGLSAPVAESVATGERWFPALMPQLVPGFLGGLVGGFGIVATSAIFTPFLMEQTIERIHNFMALVPLPTRILYGGITEELLLRWGFMTLLVWVVWRVLHKGAGKPTSTDFIVAILISSLIFGLGHLPTAIMLGETATAVVLFVIVANSVFGLVAGYLYWKYGLESAMIAHIFGHVVLASASYAGAYF
jgi:membrane protease YdiL (CAAX protease family)